jgi:glycosyltransferase involved in cell wall biosynthesis
VLDGGGRPVLGLGFDTVDARVKSPASQLLAADIAEDPRFEPGAARGIDSPLPQTTSVVINNFNYARFLPAAIESALGQTRAGLEVIVVDDGSTDTSREVIASYGAAIRPVLKPNGGMASAINAGCEIARGDVVLLLDADDLLDPEAIETVLASWTPETVMVHARLQLIDEEGKPLRGTVPAHWLPLDDGDVRPALLSRGSYSTTVTSGLALRRDALLRALPIPEDLFRQGADGYLVRAMPFLGRVTAVDRPLGYYRHHGRNWTALGTSAAELGTGLRRRLDFFRTEVEALKLLARRHGLAAAPDVGERNPDYLSLRLGSLVVDPLNHPVPGDSRVRLLPRLLSAQWFDRRRPVRYWLADVLLTAAVAVLPRTIARRLLVWRYAASARPAWVARYFD